MSDNEFKYQLRKDVNTARTLAYWSMVGLIIPILGWILGSISLSKSKSVPHDALKDELSITNEGTKKLARITLILSTLSFVAMTVVGIWVNFQTIESAKQQAAQQRNLDRENCLRKAAELDGSVYIQSNDGYEARKACFERYGN